MNTGVPASEVRSNGFIASSVKIRANPKSASLIYIGSSGRRRGTRGGTTYLHLACPRMELDENITRLEVPVDYVLSS